MKYILMETDFKGRYRVVHNEEQYTDDPTFSFEYLTYDALGQPSWREVDEHDPKALRFLLEAMCYEIARTPLEQKEVALDIGTPVICADQEDDDGTRR